MGDQAETSGRWDRREVLDKEVLQQRKEGGEGSQQSYS